MRRLTATIALCSLAAVSAVACTDVAEMPDDAEHVISYDAPGGLEVWTWVDGRLRCVAVEANGSDTFGQVCEDRKPNTMQVHTVSSDRDDVLVVLVGDPAVADVDVIPRRGAEVSDLQPHNLITLDDDVRLLVPHGRAELYKHVAAYGEGGAFLYAVELD